MEEQVRKRYQISDLIETAIRAREGAYCLAGKGWKCIYGLQY